MKWQDKSSMIGRLVEGHREEIEEKTPGQREMMAAKRVIAHVEEILQRPIGTGEFVDKSSGATSKMSISSTTTFTKSLPSLSKGGIAETEASQRRSKNQSSIDTLAQRIKIANFMSRMVSNDCPYPASALARYASAFSGNKYLEMGLENQAAHSPQQTKSGVGQEPPTQTLTSPQHHDKPVNKEQLESKIPPQGLIDHERQEAQRAHEIGLKYVWLHRFLLNALASAEHHFALKARLEHYRKLMKPKRSNLMSPLEQLRVRQSNEQASDNLQQGLIAFDKARIALKWLIQDFSLVLSSACLHQTLHDVIHRRDDVQRQQAAQPAPAMQTIVQQLEDMALELQLAEAELDLARYTNEREHLTVGLYYHDTQLTGGGSILAADCSDLSASLFSKLDGDHDGRVSAMEMQSTFDALLDVLRTKYHRVSEVEAHLNQLASKKALAIEKDNTNEIELLAVQQAETQVELKSLNSAIEMNGFALRSLWSYFHRSFAQHALGIMPEEAALGGELPFVSKAALLAGIREIGQMGFTDPLISQYKRGLERVKAKEAQQRVSSSQPIGPSSLVPPETVATPSSEAIPMEEEKEKEQMPSPAHAAAAGPEVERKEVQYTSVPIGTKEVHPSQAEKVEQPSAKMEAESSASSSGEAKLMHQQANMPMKINIQGSSSSSSTSATS